MGFAAAASKSKGEGKEEMKLFAKIPIGLWHPIRPVSIGSICLVGGVDLIERPAPSTLDNDHLHLIALDPFKEDGPTLSTFKTKRASSSYHRAFECRRKD
jgi:hypothetical protein